MHLFGWAGRALALSLLLAALAGCDAVKEQIAKDTQRPDQPTFEGLDVRLYMDQSGSAQAERGAIAGVVRSVLETYPEYLRVHRAYFAQSVKPESQRLTSSQDLDEIGRQWGKAPAKEPSNTSFGAVFDDARTELGRNSSAKSVLVVASDGGFEDEDAARASARRLASTPNLAMVVFAGVKTQNTNKRTRLEALIDAMHAVRSDLPTHIVGTDSAVEAADVRRTLKDWIDRTKPPKEK